MLSTNIIICTKNCIKTSFFLFILCAANNAFAHLAQWNTSGIKDVGAFVWSIKDLRGKHKEIDELTITPKGEWIIISGTLLYRSGNFPAGALNRI